MARDMQEHDPSGPVALTWQWALTGQGPAPIALMDWNTGPPSRQDIEWQIECPDEWRGQVPWDEIHAARSVLWWLSSDRRDQVPPICFPSIPRLRQGRVGHSSADEWTQPLAAQAQR